MTPLDHQADAGTLGLPPVFADWFAERGWRAHPHQLEMLAAAGRGDHALLIAPTGGGKTLAGFLPSLVDLAETPQKRGDGAGLHTLYVSPLKALAVDIARNLEAPIAEMGLEISCETRTGDTPPHKRQRQRERPPNILMTTPESLSLLLSFADGPRLFSKLKCLVVDELHSFAATKRGDLLALAMSRLTEIAPACRRVGLSATVHDEDGIRGWLAPGGRAEAVTLVRGAPAPDPVIEVIEPEARIPWSGHMSLHNLPEVYRAIAEHETTIVFVNTRAQAELVFQGLWRLNETALPIAVHHGSLEREQRRRVEAAMARGDLRGVVATSSLDLGIDWGDVDLVIQMGAPKGASRLLQRIGRSNHRYDEPSRARLFPGNRFEFLESHAARDAVEHMELDGEPLRPGAYDVLAQHILGTACGTAFQADDLYAQVRAAAPYRELDRKVFDEVLDFVATGGYALGTYDRYRRLAQNADGTWQVANGRVARQYRMNSGVIVAPEQLAVRLGRGRRLGSVEESFAMGLEPGDTFAFAGQLLEFSHIHEMSLVCRRARAGATEAKVPVYGGTRMPLTTHLAARVRTALADPAGWGAYPREVQDWLRKQQEVSEMPEADGLLVETFPRGPRGQERHFTVAYCFEGRNAHQTLGMLLTKRMQRAGLHPLGFVATDYVIAIWSLNPVPDKEGVAALFSQDMLGDDLEEWMAESSMLRRHFRNVAIITGIIERRHPGAEKTGRQMTFNSDLIYDVLRKHEPGHILLRATRADAATGLTDIRRLGEMLTRVHGRIRHRELEKISPLAVPVILEIGRESVVGASIDELLMREEELIAEAGFEEPVADLRLLAEAEDGDA